MTIFPRVTIAVVTYNEEKRIGQALKLIFSQNYPKDKIEVIVIDDSSTDRTVEIAKKFPVKIIMSSSKDAEVSVLKGLRAAEGEFYTFMATDMEYCTKDWLKKMVKPLIENPEIAQAATRYYVHPKDSLVSRYLSLDPLQRDPIYKFFSPSLESTIVERRDGYFITKYAFDKIPPQNAGMYRLSTMKEIYKDADKWMDLDQLCILVERGYTKFAYVPEAGFYHFHVDDFKHLLEKRYRNLTRVYLPNVNTRRYTWFHLDDFQGMMKIFIWILLANSMLPLFIKSIYLAIKNKTWLYLLEAPTAVILTDFILFHFLFSHQGRGFIIKNIDRLTKHVLKKIWAF